MLYWAPKRAVGVLTERPALKPEKPCYAWIVSLLRRPDTFQDSLVRSAEAAVSLTLMISGHNSGCSPDILG